MTEKNYQSLTITFLIIVFTCPINFLCAQSLLRGRVTDIRSDEPIPYVNLTISDSNVGTASLIDGSFQLFIEQSHLTNQVRVSCIGYKEKWFKLDSLVSLNRLFQIRLEQEVIYLDEITVSAALPNPTEIIGDVITKVNKNYPQSNFSTEMYSVITVPIQTGVEAQYQVESIMTGYYEGYGSSRKRFFKVTEKRETGSDPLASINFGYLPSWEIQTADLLLNNRQIGIFNLEFLSDFEFKYQGITMYEGDSVFIIDYKLLRNFNKVTKASANEGNYHGKIFITTNTNAVVKHQFTLVHDYEVDYKKIGDKYFPYFLKGHRTGYLRINKKNIPIIMSNEVRITDMELNSPKKLTEKDQVVMLNMIKFNPNYWNRYYPR